ncbi:insulin-like growth factor-binding protein 1b isoform X1 [Brachyhypopomus gauderio]|uniref:insulin-like growth factor-binding protein 1b isoform X1 n=1 Tax=Brachyhypopomus gauderio TaxID=698409 RepID=UPI004042D7D3
MWALPLFVVLVSIPAPGDLSPVLAPEPIRCAPCSPETLSSCPPVSSNCPEVLKEPGCGCCLACALAKGDLCGVHTAPCGTGLRCTPRPGDPHPLHSLTRGHGFCTEYETQGASFDQDSNEQAQSSQFATHRNDEKLQNVMLENNLLTEDGDVTDRGSLHYLLGLNKPLDPEAQESIKAKINAIRKKLVELGPCHTELHSALDTISTSQQALGEKFTAFYLPNCDKHGFYKAKQCETSLVGQPVRCWCVSSWSGKRIAGSSDVSSDGLCQQEVAH